MMTKNTATVVRSYQHTRSISAIAFSPDSRMFAVGSGDGSFSIWLLQGQTWVPADNRHPNAHPEGITGLFYDRTDASRLVTAGRDGKIKTWRWNATAQRTEMDEEHLAHEGGVVSLSAATLANQVLSIGNGGLAKLWSIPKP